MPFFRAVRRSEKGIQCPVCRAMTIPPENSTAKLRRNITLRNIVEQIKAPSRPCEHWPLARDVTLRGEYCRTKRSTWWAVCCAAGARAPKHRSSAWIASRPTARIARRPLTAGLPSGSTRCVHLPTVNRTDHPPARHSKAPSFLAASFVRLCRSANPPNQKNTPARSTKTRWISSASTVRRRYAAIAS